MQKQIIHYINQYLPALLLGKGFSAQMVPILTCKMEVFAW